MLLVTDSFVTRFLLLLTIMVTFKNKIKTLNTCQTLTYVRSHSWGVSMVFAFSLGICYSSQSKYFVKCCPSFLPFTLPRPQGKYMTQAQIINIPLLGIWILKIKVEGNWSCVIKNYPRDGPWVPMYELPRTISDFPVTWLFSYFLDSVNSPKYFQWIYGSFILYYFVVSTML